MWHPITYIYLSDIMTWQPVQIIIANWFNSFSFGSLFNGNYTTDFYFNVFQVRWRVSTDIPLIYYILLFRIPSHWDYNHHNRPTSQTRWRPYQGIPQGQCRAGRQETRRARPSGQAGPALCMFMPSVLSFWGRNLAWSSAELKWSNTVILMSFLGSNSAPPSLRTWWLL